MSLRARKITVAGAALVVSWLSSLAVAVWVASSHQTAIAEKVDAHEKSAADHEQRVRSLEAQSAGVAADILWIKGALVRIETKLNAKP